MEELASAMQSIIDKQVPQTGNTPENPYATNKLRDSVKVGFMVRNGNLIITTRYNAYGVWTNIGTGQNSQASQYGIRPNPFGLPPFVGYSPGKGGINPQYWTSMGGKTRVNRLKEDLLQDLRDEVQLMFKTIRKRK
jgi:hypothetical protein